MQKVPSNNLEKVVVNTGVGRLSTQPNFEDKVLPEIVREFALITGQKPARQAARQSIAGFKLRSGTVVGLKATLRGKRMNQFLERLNKVALPRVRDFRGISLKNIDEGGNLTIGIKEHIIFPEISPETSRYDFGLQISLIPKEKGRDKAIGLYKQLGIPLEKK